MDNVIDGCNLDLKCCGAKFKIEEGVNFEMLFEARIPGLILSEGLGERSG